MSIQKIDGSFALSCDICENEAEQRFDSFDDALDYRKVNGWQTRMRKGWYEDVCPDCQDAEMGLTDD